MTKKVGIYSLHGHTNYGNKLQSHVVLSYVFHCGLILSRLTGDERCSVASIHHSMA